MTFRIADTFSDALARLTAQEQKAVKTAAFDLQMNPSTPGLSMHRVDRARDNDRSTVLKSVRSRFADALPTVTADIPVNLENPGLTRAQLEDRRWKVSAPVAESTFMRLGLKLEGRAAQKI